MPTPEHQQQAIALLKALQRQEAETLQRINRKLAENHARLEADLIREYETIRSNQSLLPHQKALLLRDRLQGRLNIANEQWESEFEGLLGQARDRSRQTARDFLELTEGPKKGSLSPSDEVVNFWVEDSSERLRGWGKRYEQKANAYFEIAYQKNLGSQEVAAQLRRELGQTQTRAKGIVVTSSNSVANQSAAAQYGADNIEYAIWMSQGDDRVCPYCSARNQQVYRIGDVRVPAHVNCRCLLLPWRKEWAKNGKFDRDWAKQDREKGLSELRKAGGAPNKGRTPFEKSNGLDKAPSPIWTPERGFARGEAPPRPITKTSLSYLSLPELKALASERGLSKERVKALGKTSLTKKDTWIRAISVDSRG